MIDAARPESTFLTARAKRTLAEDKTISQRGKTQNVSSDAKAKEKEFSSNIHPHDKECNPCVLALGFWIDYRASDVKTLSTARQITERKR